MLHKYAGSDQWGSLGIHINWCITNTQKDDIVSSKLDVFQNINFF